MDGSGHVAIRPAKDIGIWLFLVRKTQLIAKDLLPPLRNRKLIRE